MPQHLPDEDRRGYEHPPPHPMRLLQQPQQPFQPQLLKDPGRSLHLTAIEIEHHTNRAGKPDDLYIPMLMQPLLLLRRAQTHPHHILRRRVDGLDHRPIIVRGKCVPERRCINVRQTHPGYFHMKG